MNRDDHNDRLVFRDVGLAAMLAPLRLVVPALGYVVLYPVILDRSGLRVLGLWSLLSTISVYMTLVDVGFSQLITREAGRDVGLAGRVQTGMDYLAARRAYLVVGAGITCLASAAAVVIGVTASFSVYPPAGIAVALPLMVATAAIVLTAMLDAAVLSGFSDNHFVQGVSAATPVITFATAIAGAFLRHPVEGFALGGLLAALSQLALFRYRLRRTHPRWRQEVELPWGDTARRVIGLTRRGTFLYAVSAGFLAREPIFRVVVAGLTGLAGVGAYDIALRVTRTLREFTAAGFTALYPAFAYFHRIDAREQMARLLRIALLLLLGGGALTLGVVLAFPNTIFDLWLQDVPPGLVSAARLLAIWQLVTIANVPFWFLLQSTGHERVAAISLWLHTTAVLILLPLSRAFQVNLSELLVYWIVTGMLTQVMIYVFTQRRLGLLLPVVRNRRVLGLLALVTAFVSIVTVVPNVRGGAYSSIQLSVPQSAVLYGVLIVSILLILRRPVQELLALAGWRVAGAPPASLSTASPAEGDQGYGYGYQRRKDKERLEELA